ncbi:uncharacterized protein [Coffea arabica]|uniref:Uncharacterized protein isoform X1 n=1 Tax=Coffea arabica TaxID=13443 RepID=A0ABM4UQA9_COFAR
MTAAKQKIDSHSSPTSCTSFESSRSSIASNNYQLCMENYNQHQMNEKLQWTSTMDFNFITTYVEWKQTKKWDNHKTNDQNYDMLATCLREQFEMQVTGGQCQSRMYRFRKKWNVFANLRGLSSKTETGIGWDEENNCFTASDEHWAQMEAVNKEYKDFKLAGSCFLYDLYTPTTLGKTATGSYAQSAKQPVPEGEHRRPVVQKPQKSKGKAAASSSAASDYQQYPWEGEDVYYIPPVPGASSGKRPASSLGTPGDREGSRGAKSTKSSSDRKRLDDAISKISRVTTASHEFNQSRYEEEAEYSVPVVQDMVKNMQLPKSVKLKATMYFAERRNAGQRCAFVRFDDAERYDYIELIMEELRYGKPPQ